MDKVYLPHAEQFDLMNENLARIANAISSEIDVSTWAGVQRAVRLGVAPGLFPIGTQLVVSHGEYGDRVYDVVAHNYFKSVKDKNAYTMTLMAHDLKIKGRFDMPEAFYYADAELPAGTYHFTIPEKIGMWNAGTYQFTLRESLPAGSQLCISDTADNLSLTYVNIVSFESPTDTESTYVSGISVGSGGTNLGTFGVELNHVERVAYGSGNYKESDIRQFLNSSADAGSVWRPQTKFDRIPSWMSSLAGFEKSIEPDFLAIIGEVVVPCATNTIYESPDSETTKGGTYILHDRFYLPSIREIVGDIASVIDDGSIQFPYYTDAVAVDRIKYGDDGVAAYWWTRSSYKDNPSIVADVKSDGNTSNHRANSHFGITPICTIV